ncbi:indole-3-acetaldehyde oxidase-like [Olea europaea subsp. europaea]|uniref:Indole-3-acetaldehyde oxidase-like n=1 Tax=Olea europaea subsp. europaea TaxID=158383 RepID=A0A8S0VMA4_OLEEU|nr:indole-3-acetaldehyde oxidase-like [Olea europaea subsp. europaea]
MWEVRQDQFLTLFADDLTWYAGDRISFAITETQKSVDVAAKLALVEYDTESLDPPILTVEEALEKSNFIEVPSYLHPAKIGDFPKGMAEADHNIFSAKVATARALATHCLCRPSTIYLDRKTNMIMAEGRHPMTITYSVDFKFNGKIIALHLDILINAGQTIDSSIIMPRNMGLWIKVKQVTVYALSKIQCNGIDDLVEKAHYHSVNLAASSYYVLESGSRGYLNYGAAASEIEGAFIQGVGFFMLEEYLTNANGLVVTDNTWMYKIRTIDTIPKQFNVELLNSGHHQKRVLSSKAFGEIPLLLTVSMHCATTTVVKAAIKQRESWGALDETDSTFELDVLATMPAVKQLYGLDPVGWYLHSLLTR